MKYPLLLVFIAVASALEVGQAQQEAKLAVTVNPSGELVVAIQPLFHAQYACAYPLTYQFDIAPWGGGLAAWEKRRAGDSFSPMVEKKAGDLFNAVEAVRFDYPSHRAYVSASFSGVSDSLYIRLADSLGRTVAAPYLGISRYFDNRRAAVTVTADDWADWTEGWYPSLIGIFRSHGLYVTAGVITGAGNITRGTWLGIQNQLNLGNVEIAAHSRTHSHTPYALPDSEVLGCARDIKLLSLPPLFSANNNGCVYVWLAPYGDFDATTDSLLGVGHYLVSRLYSYVQAPLSPWQEVRGDFAPVTPTLEIGAPSWGGGDSSLSSLNGTFDAIVGAGGVYHFMWHPQVIITDTASPYFVNHLAHISNRPDIWYVNLGHLYLYHMIQEMNSTGLTAIAAGGILPGNPQLEQNYPNPFNPSTTIRYSLPGRAPVTLSVFNSLGQLVASLAGGEQDAGVHEVKFDASTVASGVYFYRLRAGEYVQTRKMMLLH